MTWFVDQPPPMGGTIPCTAFVNHDSRDEDGFHPHLITVVRPRAGFDPGETAQAICDLLNEKQIPGHDVFAEPSLENQ